jgi:hypothetical protein
VALVLLFEMGSGTSKPQQQRQQQSSLHAVAPSTPAGKVRPNTATTATGSGGADKPLLEEPVERLSIGELRAFCAEAGLHCDDLNEKRDLAQRARKIGPLELLKPNALRRLLEVTGRNHAHCLEKSELVDSLRAAIAAGGRGPVEDMHAEQEEAWEAQRRADARRRAAAEVAAFRSPLATSSSSSYSPYSSYAEAAAAVRHVINTPVGENDEFGLHTPAGEVGVGVYAAALASERAAALAATLPPLEGAPTPGQESAAYLAAAQIATAAATAAQQQLHMLEARLQMEAERRQAIAAEKAQIEAQLADAREAIRLGRAQQSEAVMETERELAATQRQLAHLQAELHRKDTATNSRAEASPQQIAVQAESKGIAGARNEHGREALAHGEGVSARNETDDDVKPSLRRKPGAAEPELKESLVIGSTSTLVGGSSSSLKPASGSIKLEPLPARNPSPPPMMPTPAQEEDPTPTAAIPAKRSSPEPTLPDPELPPKTRPITPPPPHLAPLYQDPLADMNFDPIPDPQAHAMNEGPPADGSLQSSPMGARHGLALSAEEEALYAEIDQIDVMRSPEKKANQPEPVEETPATISSSVIASILGSEEAGEDAAEGETADASMDPAEAERQERLARAARQRRRNRNR